jgi:deazaflavin-dependent oxidoreductase (nitroreductase family)
MTEPEREEGVLPEEERERNATIREFSREHAQRYIETDGGGEGENENILILTTIGRSSGQPRSTPLIYLADGDRQVVIASNGGSTDHPGWYKNLSANADVRLQIKAEKFPARARTATGDERARLWSRAIEAFAPYAEYQERTAREIPVVVLERTAGE